MKAQATSKSLGLTRGSGFTVVGLSLVILGWALLIGGILVSEATLHVGSLVGTMSLRADIITLAQTAIVSGLGLAVIGALRSGFSAFSRFFDAVLQRSATPRSVPVSDPEPAPTVSVAPTERTPPPLYDRPPPVAPTLRAKERNYAVLPDGSVEVETMFGTRVFATLDEAREFIR